jgi:hypothetical protein
MSSPASVVVRSARPLAASVDDEIVMLSPDQGAYYGLNAVGSRIWELIDRPRSVTDLCAVLAAEFMVDDETCLAEVLAFLDRLERADLVEVDP